MVQVDEVSICVGQWVVRGLGCVDRFAGSPDDQISCVVGCETGVQWTLAVHGRLVGLPSGWILLLSLLRGLGRAKPTSVRPNEDHNCMLGTLLSLCTMVLAQHLQARGLLFKCRFNRPSCLSAGCTVQRLPARCLVGLQDL